MKTWIAAVVVAFCTNGTVLAGPNRGGTLILHVNPSVVYTIDSNTYCGASALGACKEANPATYGSAFTLAYVLAAFHPATFPELGGVSFGIGYPSPPIVLDAWGACGEFYLQDDHWPSSGSGVVVSFTTARTTHITECFWFAAYNYHAGTPSGSLCLIPHPQIGAKFADGSVPAILDPIAGLGCLGFDEPGIAPCPEFPVPIGACCLPEYGGCVVATADECSLANGKYGGDDTDCNPDPCPEEPPTGACCVGWRCFIATAEECAGAQQGEYQGDGTDCDHYSCETISTRSTTWGAVKRTF